MQLHKDETGKFRFFSRNGFDFSDDFGHSAAQADKFSSHSARCLAPGVRSAILDGEICAYNHQTDSLTQKGEQMNIRNLRADDPVYQQCLYLYDIVYLNGRVLTNLPLRERLEILSQLVVEERGRVQLADRKTGSSTKDVVDALNDAIDRREEGLVLKDPDSVYRPNVRTKGGWIKVKPEYSGSLVDQCDLIIMGGYFGSGRRGGVVTHFILGLVVTDAGEEDDHEVPRVFRSFCRVGSGYSYRELSDLLRRLQPNLKSAQRRLQDSNTIEVDGYSLEFAREKPDVWIDPRKSVLLQVKAAEIVASDIYKAGCTLRWESNRSSSSINTDNKCNSYVTRGRFLCVPRFPRVEKIRSESDKPWHSCMTMKEMESLKKEGEGKLANRHFSLGTDEEGDDDDDAIGAGPSRKRRKKKAGDGGAPSSSSSWRVRPAATVSSLYRPAADADRVMVETHDLKGRIIVVEPCDARMKRRLEEIVLRHGGTCEQNVTRERTFCYVETGMTVRARSVINSGHYDVVRHEWLMDCERTFRPFRPSDMVHVASEETKARFDRDFDTFGDAFAERATAESLRYSMDQVAEKGAAASVTRDAMGEFESRYFDSSYVFGLFRHLLFYVDKEVENGGPNTEEEELDPLDLVKATLRFYGGTVAASLEDPDVTHVVVRGGDGGDGERRLAELKGVRRQRKSKFHIVTEEWVEDCVGRMNLLQERDYEPE